MAACGPEAAAVDPARLLRAPVLSGAAAGSDTCRVASPGGAGGGDSDAETSVFQAV